ncbi:MAG: hypothetical protein B1H03_02140 [Planctomycetales bacterium 4484_113]|nr:MAG: hypothetical protein B1H03_02140 [Planctomycetales bacterium 4484_113]
MWWSLDFWLKNHFVPWGRIGSFALLVVHLYLVWWVYRDAERRFHNGVWFALFAAIFPLGGWLFYLVYRSSSLPMKAIGASMQHALSPRRRRLQEKMELLRLLTEVPVPDDQLEELIYQGNLPVARLYCEDQLMLAKEQNDERRIISYERYLHRVQELERRESERDDTH